MHPLLVVPFLLALQPTTPSTTTPPAPPPPAAATSAGQDLKPLSFYSQRFNYKWDTLLPINYEVDGLKVNTIFFNRRQATTWPIKGADFGARAQVEVTNTSKSPRVPGFVVAVFDSENRLLGVASGGAKVGNTGPGKTETFDLNFSKVTERLPLGAYFYFSVELSE
jgi:hypothetical protein